MLLNKLNLNILQLGKIFNKGLDKDNQKEGLFKRLENIKDKNKGQLQAIKDQEKNN